ncbi:MAG: UPF0721 transmembrane protein [Lysobacterales bacterium]|jgi:uncharacterized membrane protein YfcA|nr:MAG: UPF0721 transmembrane protein [Xanthomonadales bacterium]
MSLVLLLSCLPLGLAAGLIAGLLGVGGGLLLVPALAVLLPWLGAVEPAQALPMAVATSLGSILITAPVSAAAHAVRGAVDFRATGLLAPGLVLGAAGAGWIAGDLPVRILALILAGFFLFIAWRLTRPDPRSERGLRPRSIVLPAGLIVGALSALVGIGGGSLVVPLLLRLGLGIHRAIGTAAACGLPIAIGGVLGWSVSARGDVVFWWPGAWVLGSMSALSAPFGAALAQRAPARTLRRLFAAFLVLSAGAIAWRHR